MLCPIGCPKFSVYEFIYVYIHIYTSTFVLDLGCVHMREIISEITLILDWPHKFRAATCEVGLHRSLTFPIPHSLFPTKPSVTGY